MKLFENRAGFGDAASVPTRIGSYTLNEPRGADPLKEALFQTPPNIEAVMVALSALAPYQGDATLVGEYLALLSKRVQARMALGPQQALVSVLFDEEGFGPIAQADRPVDHAFIESVIASKRGLPGMICGIALAVAARAGIRINCVSSGGKLFLKMGDVWMNPFERGQVVPAQTDFTLQDTFALAFRMCGNLKAAFIAAKQLEAALEVTDLLLVFQPDHPLERRIRAQLLAELGAYRAALDDVKSCLAESPAPPDRVVLKRAALQLSQRIALLH